MEFYFSYFPLLPEEMSDSGRHPDCPQSEWFQNFDLFLKQDPFALNRASSEVNTSLAALSLDAGQDLSS